MSPVDVLMLAGLAFVASMVLTEVLSGGFRAREVKRWLTCFVRGHLWEARPHVGVGRDSVEVARYCDRCERWFRWRV